MNTPTPETDALRDSLWNLVERTSVSFHVEQFLKLARKLERERDEAVEAIRNHLFMYQDCRVERDQLKKDVEFLKSSECEAAWCDRWKNICSELSEVERERDQLRKVVDELADALKLEMNTGFSCRELRAYNQLPHVQERNKSK